MKIIPYEPKYRDDMLFCYLSAKDALGKTPSLKEDLLDIEANYILRGDMFWLAVEDGRVVGMVGTNTVSNSEIWLKRLYVKPTHKRRGIGGALLAQAEEYAARKGVAMLHTRFNDDYLEALNFYSAKGFTEAARSEGLCHFVKLILTLDKKCSG